MVGKALDQARTLNALYEQAETEVGRLKGSTSSSSASARATDGVTTPTPANGGAISAKENVRVSIQMPERYNGGTDFRAWLRRYENTANAAGWSAATKALRLGMYLSDDYYESWDQYASKNDFEKDCQTLSHVFARTTTDASLEKFYALKWAGETNLSVFLARARRVLEEYNRKLPPEKWLSAATIDQMVLDKLVSVAPPAAKAELRKTKPTSIEEMVDIVSDYTDSGQGTSALPVSTLQKFEDRLDNKLAKVMAAVTGAQSPVIPSDSITKLTEKITALEKQVAARTPQGRPRYSGSPKCGICTAGHITKNCPLKQFDKGCYMCGAEGHLARQCPKSLLKAQKAPSGEGLRESGN
ncbi:hypothetical protein Pmar_PMAR019076 [Perkinsus marinus ATCC 50983]|uniref:CCHC-type domain-containing protein n=1 Tax=Perkinsus marinus (strain ATCC 50983 / TXsc) TaxID=423536 RepID=C5KTT2_PERM5|nr:hypothetical protein Pmar_PMAR019076 [Perkinsus marinus ATCC 50983]EER11974.1 hypothetical protein Pmar_PMAR019076 [Perkinsus marinus ATCC 50983]|eukprot:XP_002780179.1 hypothetical protein Pmar_PMAR019076 [Perkinsus marinus ATCC 50983]